MYAPGLDIDLVKKLQLPTNVLRTSINFMGCYAAFNAFKIADAFCQAWTKMPRSLLSALNYAAFIFKRHLQMIT